MVNGDSNKSIIDASYYYQDAFEQTCDALDTIPHDASVTSYGFFVPYLSYIDDLHTCPDYYADYEQTDYVVVDTRYKNDSHTAKMIASMEDDYTLVCEGGYAQIYKRNTADEE